MYSFATPPIKLGQQICGGLLIANHLDESLWWANQKHWAAVRSYLLHSFLQVHSSAALFTKQRRRAQLWGAKTTFLNQTVMLWIFFIDYCCAGSHTEHRWRCSYYLKSLPSMYWCEAGDQCLRSYHHGWYDGSLMPVPVYIYKGSSSLVPTQHLLILDTYQTQLPGKNFHLADLEFCFQEHKRLSCKQTLLWDSSLW
jgi:hypothetical protein